MASPSRKDLVPCVGCGGLFPPVEGPIHRYMTSSPGCWACFGEVLIRDYTDPRHQEVHRLTVDAYAVQHPGQPSPQTIRSIALHLISLCAIFEEGVETGRATALLRQAARDKERFRWLTPPASLGRFTVADVHEAGHRSEHVEAVQAWAASAWEAWAEHHDTVRAWLRESWPG